MNELQQNLKQLIESSDPTNWELAIQIGRGDPELYRGLTLDFWDFATNRNEGKIINLHEFFPSIDRVFNFHLSQGVIFICPSIIYTACQLLSQQSLYLNYNNGKLSYMGGGIHYKLGTYTNLSTTDVENRELIDYEKLSPEGNSVINIKSFHCLDYQIYIKPECTAMMRVYLRWGQNS